MIIFIILSLSRSWKLIDILGNLKMNTNSLRKVRLILVYSSVFHKVQGSFIMCDFQMGRLISIYILYHLYLGYFNISPFNSTYLYKCIIIHQYFHNFWVVTELENLNYRKVYHLCFKIGFNIYTINIHMSWNIDIKLTITPNSVPLSREVLDFSLLLN